MDDTNNAAVPAVAETLPGDIGLVEDDVTKLVADGRETATYARAHVSDVVAAVVTSIIAHMQTYHAGDVIVAELLALRAKL